MRNPLSPPAAETTVVAPEPGPAPAQASELDASSDDAWPTGGPPKGLRLGLPTLLLSAAILVGLGFIGGAQAYKHQHPATAASSSTNALRFGAGSGGGAGTAAGAAAATSTNRTIGTVANIDGSTLYVTSASGNLVKVTVPDGTTITVTRTGGAVTDLRPGDTVIVTGAPSTDGSTKASSIAVNPQNAGGARPAGNQSGGQAPPSPAGG